MSSSNCIRVAFGARGVGRAILFIAGLCLTATTLGQAITYTHFVTPNGSPTNFCTQQQPCSLTRAVAMVGSASMPPGSTVLVRRGADGSTRSRRSRSRAVVRGASDQVHRRERRTHHRIARQAGRVGVDAGSGPAIYLSDRLGRDGTVSGLAGPTAPGGELATNGSGSATAVHDIVESPLRPLVSSALLRALIDG